jgi:hypothetical protein
MPYMNCPRCGLSIRLRASSLLLERCPRCLARTRTVIPMYTSEHKLPAGSGSTAPLPVSERRPAPLIAPIAPSPDLDLTTGEPSDGVGPVSPDLSRAESLIPGPPAEVPVPGQFSGHGFVTEWSS